MKKISEITISQEDIDDILRQAIPGEAASFTGNACTFFKKSKTLLLTGVAILHFVYPPAAGAVQALIAIMEKACEE